MKFISVLSCSFGNSFINVALFFLFFKRNDKKYQNFEKSFHFFKKRP